MLKTDVVIIGAGVVGLAIGGELARSGLETVIVERNSSFGQETSLRNSEVIHGGMYYPREFFTSASRLMPFLSEADLSADTCGIRSKLQGARRIFPGFCNSRGSGKRLTGFNQSYRH